MLLTPTTEVPAAANAADLTPPPSVAAIVRFLEEIEARTPAAEAASTPGTVGANAARFGQELAGRTQGGLSSASPGISAFSPRWTTGAASEGFYTPSVNQTLAAPGPFSALPATQEITDFLDWLSRLNLLPATVFGEAEPAPSVYGAAPPDQFYLSPSGPTPAVASRDSGRGPTSGFYEAPPLSQPAKTPNVAASASASGRPAAFSPEETTETPAARRRRNIRQRERERESAAEEKEAAQADEAESRPRRRLGLPALEKALMMTTVLGATAAFGITRGREMGFAQGVMAAQTGSLPAVTAPRPSPLDFFRQWGGLQPSAPPQPYPTPGSALPLGHPAIPPVSYTGRATTAPTRSDLIENAPPVPQNIMPEPSSAPVFSERPSTQFFPRPIRVPRAPFGETPPTPAPGSEGASPDASDGPDAPQTPDSPEERWRQFSYDKPLESRLPGMPQRAALPLRSVPSVLTGTTGAEELSSSATGDAAEQTPGKAVRAAWDVSSAIAALLLLPHLPAQAGALAGSMAAERTQLTEVSRTVATGQLALPTLNEATRLLSRVSPLALQTGEKTNRGEALTPQSIPLTRSLVGGAVLPPDSGGDGPMPSGNRLQGGLPAPRPEMGQLTIVAPPLLVSPPDAERNGVGLRLDWQTLAGGAGVLDASSFARLQAALPETAQVFYPALPPGSLGANAVNMAVDADLLTGLLSRAYGPDAETLAGPSALLGRVGAGRTAALPLPAALVPTGVRPMGSRASLLGETPGSTGALESAGGDSARGGALDLLGMPVRVAPTLAGTSELTQAVAVRSSDPGAPTPVRPREFAPLKDRLFGAFQSVETEPDAAEWRKAAPSFGLRDSRPTTLLAPDARVARMTDTTPLPQMGDATAAAGSPIAALSPVLASAVRSETPAQPGSGPMLSSPGDALTLAGIPSLSGAGTPAPPSVLPATTPHTSGPPLGLSRLLNSLPHAAEPPSVRGVPSVSSSPMPQFRPALPAVIPSPSADNSPRVVGSLPAVMGGRPLGEGSSAAPAAGVPIPRSPMTPRLPSLSPASLPPMSAAPLEAEPNAAGPAPTFAPLVSPAALPTPREVFGELPQTPLAAAPAGWGAARPQMTLSSGPRPGRKGGPMLLQKSAAGSQGVVAEPREAERSGESNARSQLSSGEGGASAAEVELLSTEVYSLLKRRLKNELERRGRW